MRCMSPNMNINTTLRIWISEENNFGPELIHSVEPREARFQKPRWVCFFFPASATKFWKSGISGASGSLGLFGDVFGCSTPSKSSVLLHKNSLVSCQWRRHSVEPRALTCPFKQSNMSAWSLLSWHPTYKYLRGRLCVVHFFLVFGLLCRHAASTSITAGTHKSMKVVCRTLKFVVSRSPGQVTWIMSTEALLSNGFD